MKLFKKILSAVLSFGMICSSAFAVNNYPYEWDAEWDDEVFRVIASHTPNNLDECCQALDDALRNKEEIKEKIKHSSDDMMSYIRHISCTHFKVGYRIGYYWLYLPKPGEVGESGRRIPSSLADLFYVHGADFGGEADPVMVSIIFENYRYYLNNGKSRECSIEDMAIDHWFNFWRCFNPNFERKKLERMMARWPEVKAAHYRALRHNEPSVRVLKKLACRLFCCCLP